ncbi:hypothetical protein FJY71_00290 [candidate division WOR-3 bacterium]|nr:hypothetical protein [candidate division WOR-3 bacterium]
MCGYRLLSPDQERLVEAVQTHPRVAAMGGTGTGKSFVYGATAALTVATSSPSKALFGGPKLEQAARLSWLELQRTLTAAAGRGFNLAGAGCGVTDWYPLGKDTRPDWFAVCMALSDRNQAAAVKGMLHSARVLVVLDELEGIASEVRDALDAGTTQDNAHYWVAFNPVNPDDAAGQFWAMTPSEARVQLSALRCAEWQAQTGKSIPGMPTLAVLEAKWRGRENEPLYYTNVLGEFPPQSAESVVVPTDWFDRVADCLPDDADAGEPVYLGLDTAGGGAENVLASMRGRVVRIEWADREHHQTPALVLRVKRTAEQYGGRVPVAIDYVGLGGKGVGDDLSVEGWPVLPFIGGGKEFAGRRDETGLTTDVVTWAWFELRERVRLTVQAIDAGRPERFISLPRDPVLREQLARPFDISQERRYELREKSRLRESPDRADAVAMAVLCATAQRTRVVQSVNVGVL